MKTSLKWMLLLFSGSLVACGTQATGAQPNSGARIVVVDGREAHGVSVTGRGEVLATPDTAFIDVGIETHGATVATARASGAKAMNALIAALKKNGVAPADIQTSQLSIAPRYDYAGGGEPRLNGYTMTTSVAVRVRDLDRVSQIVDDSAEAAGNAARVSGIRFSVEDAAALRDKAREAAIAEAKRKAEQIAKVSGTRLGELVGIEEIAASAPPLPIMLEAADVTSARTPIERGTSTLSVEVRARWALAG